MKMFSKHSIILFMILSCVVIGEAQYKTKLTDVQEVHAKQVMESLDKYHPLRLALESGDRGDGIHYPWMDEMQELGIKEASYTLNFIWNKKLTKLEIVEVGYYSQYYVVDNPKADNEKFKRLINSSLKSKLDEAIKIKAESFIPNTIGNKKACGTAYLKLLDDETLPILNPPTYLYEGKDKPQWCK